MVAEPVPPVREESPPPVITNDSAGVGEEVPLPDEAEEGAMLEELRSRGETMPVRPSAEPDDTVAKTPLPALDKLVARVPSDVREVLDELFRARFTAVRRMPARGLKEPVAD